MSEQVQADARVSAPENDIQCFRWVVGRLRLGQARRYLRDVAFDEGAQISLDEERGLPWCTIYVTLRGSKDQLDATMLRYESDFGPMEEE